MDMHILRAGRDPVQTILLAFCFLLLGCSAAQGSTEVQGFFERIEADGGPAWMEAEGDAFVARLPRSSQVTLAELSTEHSNPGVRLFGLAWLYRLNLEQRADSAAAALVLRGDDLTGLAWTWMHSSDPALLGRRLDGIKRELRLRIPSMTPEERTRADKILCDGQSECAYGQGAR